MKKIFCIIVALMMLAMPVLAEGTVNAVQYELAGSVSSMLLPNSYSFVADLQVGEVSHFALNLQADEATLVNGGVEFDSVNSDLFAWCEPYLARPIGVDREDIENIMSKVGTLIGELSGAYASDPGASPLAGLLGSSVAAMTADEPDMSAIDPAVVFEQVMSALEIDMQALDITPLMPAIAAVATPAMNQVSYEGLNGATASTEMVFKLNSENINAVLDALKSFVETNAENLGLLNKDGKLPEIVDGIKQAYNESAANDSVMLAVGVDETGKASYFTATCDIAGVVSVATLENGADETTQSYLLTVSENDVVAFTGRFDQSDEALNFNVAYEGTEYNLHISRAIEGDKLVITALLDMTEGGDTTGITAVAELGSVEGGISLKFDVFPTGVEMMKLIALDFSAAAIEPSVLITDKTAADYPLKMTEEQQSEWIAGIVGPVAGQMVGTN